MRLAELAFASLATLASASCGGPRGGTDVGNGATVTVDLQGFNRTTSTTADPQSLVVAGTTLNEVWITVERLRLEPGDQCAAGPSTRPPDAVGPFVANLLTDGVVGQKPEAMVVPGTYCGLELRARKLAMGELPSNVPAAVENTALYMAGKRADGVSFTVSTTRNIDFRLRSATQPFEVRDGEPFILGFDLARMLEALELDSIDETPIVINDSVNAERLDALAATIKEAAHLYEDRDNDGELSDDEAVEGSELADGEPD